jgi:hypothetical protein
LICAPSNTAIDFVADRLHMIPCLRDKFVRIYPDSREDLYTLDETNIKPYSLLYKVIKESPYFSTRTKDEIYDGVKPKKFFRGLTEKEFKVFLDFRK